MSLARIGMEITSRCNLACVHCMRDRSIHTDLPLKLVRKILDELKPYGIHNVSFTGGEPLVHPQFKEIIREVVKRDYVLSLVTNGLKLPEFADFFAQPEVRGKVERVCVSLEGADEKTHEKVRGKGTWKKAMSGILALKARELPLAVKFTITAWNYRQLEEMVFVAGKLGADQLQLSHLHPTPENMAAGMMIEPEQWRKMQEQVEQLKKLVKLVVYFSSENLTDEAIPMCTSLAMMDYYVDSRGWLGLCCTLPGIAGRKPGQAEPERVADLNTTSFVEAHKKLVKLISRMRLASIERIEKGLLSELEHFQCLQCAFQTGKLDWLEQFSESTWAQMLKKAKEKQP